MRAKLLVCALLCAALLTGMAAPALADASPAAYDVAGKTLDAVVGDYLAYRNIPADRIAIGYYNTATDETWYHNENQYMRAGSMYKLPLAMVYFDGFRDGTYQPDTRTGGYTLWQLIRLAVQYSSNDAAASLYNYYSPNTYAHRAVLARYSDVPEEELPKTFFYNNYISPHIMLDTLRHLYAHSEEYAEIIQYMKDAHPGLYFKKYEGEYEIAHKYGAYEGAYNDCAVIYTPQPFLLVVFTSNLTYAERTLGELAELMTRYTLAVDRAGADRQRAQDANALLFTYGSPCVYLPEGTQIVDEAPYIDESGAVMFPLRTLAEGLGAAVGWDAETQRILVTGSGKEIRLRIGASELEMDGVAYALPCPTALVNGKTMTAAYEIIRALGGQIDYTEDGMLIRPAMV